MLHESVDYFVIEVDSLIAYKVKWARKSYKDVFIEEIGGIFSRIVTKCYGLGPLRSVVGSYKNIPIN